MVRDAADVVEGKRHGLQGRQLTQSLHRDLPQRVIIQPEVTERTQVGKTAGGNAGDMIGVQTATAQITIIIQVNRWCSIC